jgi:hypothetical protein
MLKLDLSSREMLIYFVFLECLFRLLLVWHEEMEPINARKNIRMVSHLLIKYELKSHLEKEPRFEQAVQFLQRNVEENSWKNR